MNSTSDRFKKFITDLNKIKDYFLKIIDEKKYLIKIYTHLDADGLSAGAILGKTLYNKNIPFQITVLKQLELDNIRKIDNETESGENFLIFSDFGSGQYLELQKNIKNPFLIFDHHLPQNIKNKEEIDKIQEIYKDTYKWHINPYFYGFDGSNEISGSGMCYFFAKCIDKKNTDLSKIALVGANGDVQNQGDNKSFIGLNQIILDDAKENDIIEILDDINLSRIKPLNQALAYSPELRLPGLNKDPNKTLKFLKRLGILIEKNDGSMKTLIDLNKEEKQKLTSALIEYTSIKSNIDPSEIINKLIIKRYLLKDEKIGSVLHDISDFSNILNSCGRTNNASIGIAIAMGDRNKAYVQAIKNLENYKRMLLSALTWIKEENIIKEEEFIQYFFGADKVPENIIGTITSMLIHDDTEIVKKNKPLFGYAIRMEEGMYKISSRAHESIVEKGINLSEAIREALIQLNLENLGGGHPPAAGTKVPIEKIGEFLENCNKIIGKQLK